MSRLNSVATLAAGDEVDDVWTAQVPKSVNYLTVAGADITTLPSNTATIAAQFHRVTAATGNLDSILDALGGDTAGQVVELYFTNAMTIRHNGGGTGNIRNRGGGDINLAAGLVVRFVFDGSHYQSQLTAYPGQELDYAQVTANSASISAATPATAVTLVTGNSVTYDGSKVKITFNCPWVIMSAGTTIGVGITFVRDTTIVGVWRGGGASSSFTSAGGVLASEFDTPPAGAHTYKIGIYNWSGGGGSLTAEASDGIAGDLSPMWMQVQKA
jgi:hypothetical protein